MRQLLRITYGSKDYSYQLLNEKPISKGVGQIHLLLEGHSVTLVRKDGQWLPSETTHDLDHGLLKAIGKAISLRYRI